MTKINYTTGDATAPSAIGNKIIVHICNDIGGWGKGFVMSISKRRKQPEAAYRQWHGEQTDFALGAVQIVQVETDTWVANLIGQHGVQRKGTAGPPPIRYDAIAQGLTKVADEAERLCASVHMPRIGCGLAGGRWEEVEPIIRQTLVQAGVAVTVYDFT